MTYKEYSRLRESARSAITLAISRGILPRLSRSNIKCKDCESRATDYDHRDYRKPFMVDAVCHKCNVKRGQDILGRKYFPTSSIPRDFNRETKILEMKKSGLSDKIIGKKFDLSRQRVWAIIDRVRKEGKHDLSKVHS